jgi:hypothetical protein
MSCANFGILTRENYLSAGSQLFTGSVGTRFLSLGVFEGKRTRSNPHSQEDLKQNAEL